MRTLIKRLGKGHARGGKREARAPSYRGRLGGVGACSCHFFWCICRVRSRDIRAAADWWFARERLWPDRSRPPCREHQRGRGVPVDLHTGRRRATSSVM